MKILIGNQPQYLRNSPLQTPIYVQTSPNSDLSIFIQNLKPSLILVLVTPETELVCYPEIKPLLPTHTLLVIPSGEENKNLDTCQQVWKTLTASDADRQSLIINIGGGMLCDLGGFCAALFKRGIRFIHIPTTLLAQTDAAIGGKTGVDFLEFKNQVGVMAQAAAIFSYTSFLHSLPEAEILSGLAEIVKHHLIADAPAWDKLRHREIDNLNWPELVTHSVSIKTRITEADYNESGQRKLLNFGHTAGHALESFFLETNRGVPHGHCVAAGMVIEAYISYQRGLLPEKYLEDIEEYIYSNYGKLEFHVLEIPEMLLRAANDKKNKNGQIGCVLLHAPGKADYNGLVTNTELENAFQFYL